MTSSNEHYSIELAVSPNSSANSIPIGGDEEDELLSPSFIEVSSPPTSKHSKHYKAILSTEQSGKNGKPGNDDMEDFDDGDDDLDLNGIQLITAAKVKRRELIGLAYMAISAWFFSLMSLLVNITSTNYPASQLVFVRSIMQMLFSALYIKLVVKKPLLGPSRPPQVRRWLVMRGLCGSISLAMFYYALSALTLADATVIFFTGPIFTAIFAYWMMKEPMGPVEVVSAVACLFGIVLVARPSFLFHDTVNDDKNVNGDSLSIMSDGHSVDTEFRRKHTIGAIAAFVGAMISGIAYVSVRKITKLTKECHTMILVFYFGMISSMFSPIILFGFDKPILPTSIEDILAFLGVGCLAFLGQIFMNRGLQMAPAGPATQMRNLDIVFAFVYDLFLLKKVLKWTSYAGTLIIITATIAIGISRWMKSK